MDNLSDTAPASRAGGLLLLFTGLHGLDHVDRHLVANFAPQTMAELSLSRAQFALFAGLAFSLVCAAAAPGAGLLADRLAARFGLDRALTFGFALLCLVPLLLRYRLAPAGSPLVLAGMVGSILFVTGCHGPAFAMIGAGLPQALKASLTWLDMRLVNMLMMGGLAVLIGAASGRLLAAGPAASRTIPLAAADLLSALALLCLFAAARARGLSAMNAAQCLGSQA